MSEKLKRIKGKIHNDESTVKNPSTEKTMEGQISDQNLKVTVYLSIKDVPRERTGDFLSGDDRQLLSLLEKLNPCGQRYYFGENAFLVTYRQKINLLSFTNWGKLPYTLRIVGFPVSIVKKGYFGDPKEAAEMIRSLKGFTLVLNGEKDLKLPRGYTLSTYQLMILDKSFKGYLERMRSPYRYRLNKALQKRNLYRVRSIPQEAFDQELYDLYKAVYQRSEAPLECLPPEFFKEMPGEILVFEEEQGTVPKGEKAFDENTRLSKGLKRPRLLGFVFLSCQKDTVNFLFGGFFEEDVAKYDLYYGMLLEMVKTAIHKGGKYVEFGQTAEESKAKLGAAEEKKYLYLTHSNSLINKIIPLLLPIGSYQPGKHIYRVFKEHRHSGDHLEKKLVLKKIRGKTLFEFFNPVVVEPLELEYIETALEDLPLQVVIEDPFFSDKRKDGDIYLFNGYNTGFEAMKKEAKEIKRRDPSKIIIVSGVDVQINGEQYMVDVFDYVFTSSDLFAFQKFMQGLLKGESVKVPGLIINHGTDWERIPKEREQREGLEANQEQVFQREIPMPSRRFFHQYREQTYYLHYQRVALVKKSSGCPYSCRFCFCRNLNEGKYEEGSYQRMFQEIEKINADYYWIVDDVFLKNNGDVEEFLRAQKEHMETLNIKQGKEDKKEKRKKPEPLIVYLRADFIRSEKESLNTLKEAGITEIIIGLESVKEETLKNYQKGVTGDDNAEAVEILNQSGIAYTALFMVDPSDRVRDFKALRVFIKQQGIQKYTFSIFTPIKGADDYEAFREEIMEFDQTKYDFLHLVLPPKHMSRRGFQWEFIKLHIFQFFHSKDARSFLFKSLFKRRRGR